VNPQRVLIVGAGHVGLYAALRLSGKLGRHDEGRSCQVARRPCHGEPAQRRQNRADADHHRTERGLLDRGGHPIDANADAALQQLAGLSKQIAAATEQVAAKQAEPRESAGSTAVGCELAHRGTACGPDAIRDT